jgi:hypothetical protein
MVVASEGFDPVLIFIRSLSQHLFGNGIEVVHVAEAEKLRFRVGETPKLKRIYIGPTG